MEIITSHPIVLSDILTMSRSTMVGGVVLFSGEVRASNMNNEVSHIEYEAFKPLAEKIITKIVDEAIAKWKLEYAFCQHRIGKVGICESAVAVVTAAKHRKEAYLANQFIMHYVKHEAPIWKKEYLTDGSYIYGQNCNCFGNKHESFESTLQ